MMSIQSVLQIALLFTLAQGHDVVRARLKGSSNQPTTTTVEQQVLIKRTEKEKEKERIKQPTTLALIEKDHQRTNLRATKKQRSSTLTHNPSSTLDRSPHCPDNCSGTFFFWLSLVSFFSNCILIYKNSAHFFF
jgi:hypothetical protein